MNNYVLVCLSYYNKVPQTGWLTNDNNLFFIVLEAGESKVKVPAVLLSGEELRPGSRRAVFLL